MAKLTANVSLDTDRAIRDPLFWFGMMLDKITFGLIDMGRWKRYVSVNTGNASDAIEWELNSSEGTVVRLGDVVFDWDVVEVPDSNDPQALARREIVGPVKVKAVVVDDPQAMG